MGPQYRMRCNAEGRMVLVPRCHCPAPNYGLIKKQDAPFQNHGMRVKRFRKI